MLFSYLISTVFNLHGPVTNYWSHRIDAHISYEYVITEGDRCNIALGVRRDDTDQSVSWKSFPVKDEMGNDVVTRGSRESSVWSGYVPDHDIFNIGSLRPGYETRVAYLMEPKNPKFSFTISLNVEDTSGNIKTETTTVRCDVSQCKCKEDR